MNNTVKTILRLFLGILSIIVTTLLIVLLFKEVIYIKNLQVLKWFPLLICFIGFYLAGLINRKTKLALTFFLFIALIVFIPLKQFYFPIFLLIILFSALSIIATRRELSKKVTIPSLVFLIILFGVYLFSQPLIINNKGHGIDTDNNLYNATVLWDFTTDTPVSLPNEKFIDKNGTEISLENFEGKTLYITFWATWCGPCLGEKPELEKFKNKFQDNPDIVFIDISVDSDIENWRTYLSNNEQIGIQLITKNDAKTRVNYQFSGIPYHIIVDSDGKFKGCQSARFINNELLTNPDKLTEYINTSYKVFKTIQTNGKDTTIRVR